MGMPIETPKVEVIAVPIYQRLSSPAQQAIRYADFFRKDLVNSDIDAKIFSELILLGLLVHEKGPATVIFNSFNLSVDQYREWIGYRTSDFSLMRERDAELSPNLDYEQRISNKNFSPIALEILARARGITLNIGPNTLIRQRHLLRAIFLVGKEKENSNENPVAYKWFQEARINTDQVLQVLIEVSEDEDIDPGMFRRAPKAAFKDIASEKDELGFNRHARSLAEIIIKEETLPPVVIGIYGAWGSGKSTFMKLVKNYLEKWGSAKKDIPNLSPKLFGRFRKKTTKKSQKIICVEYDAWAHIDAERVWVSLLSAISKQMDSDIGVFKRAWIWLSKTTKRLIGAIILGLLPVISYLVTSDLLIGELRNRGVGAITLLSALPIVSGLIFMLTRSTPITDLLQKALKEADSSEMDSVISDVQTQLREIIKKNFLLDEPVKNKSADDTNLDPQESVTGSLQKSKLKVVVFIDELDRCPLEQVVNILEAIKLFLSEEIFIVLIAVDTRVVAEAISLHYKDVDNPELPREYMEKIIQVPVQVPRATDEKLMEYILSLMPVPDQEIKPKADLVNPTPKSSESEQTGYRLPVLETDNHFEMLNLNDTVAEQRAISEVTIKLLDGNPRQVKRLLNTYRYVKVLGTRAGQPIDDEIWQKDIICWLGMTMKWPVFMDIMGKKFSSETSKLHYIIDNSAYDILRAASLEFSEQEPIPDKEILDIFLTHKESWFQDFYLLANNFIAENPPRKSKEKTDKESKDE